MSPDTNLGAIRRLEQDVEAELAAARREAEARRAAAAAAADQEVEQARRRGAAEAERRSRATLEAADREAAAILAEAAAAAETLRRHGEMRERAVSRMAAVVLPDPEAGGRLPMEGGGPCSSR